MKKLIFFATVLAIASLNSPEAGAVPAPPSLDQICKSANLIVKGEYVGGVVSEVKDCEFWVTFQIKPEKYFKKPGTLADPKVIEFKKRYFEDTKACSRLPGPNAMPGDMKEKLEKPTHDKKLFFFKSASGTMQELADIFWGIVDWNTAKKEWHEEFKATASCHQS